MTIRELSKIAGVSSATVSIVLNGKKGVSEGTRRHVLEIARQYGYNNTRKAAPSSNSILFIKYSKHGMMVEENQGFVSSIMDAIEKRCRAGQYNLSIMLSDNDLENTIQSIDYSAYAGAIVLATELTEENYPYLRKIPIPFVAVDNPMTQLPYSTVVMDNTWDVHKAIRYCMECGYKSIAHFKSAIHTANMDERHRAFIQFTAEFGLHHDREQHQFVLAPTMMGSYESMKNYLKRNPVLPECAFADNDTIAIGAIKALKEFGYRIPHNIAVVGFDDIPFSAVNSPPLTTIHVHRELIGFMAVDHLCMLFENPEFTGLKTRVTSDLVVRTSMNREQRA